MWVAVFQPTSRQQLAGFDQPCDNRLVGGAEPAQPFALGLQDFQAAEQG